MSLILIIAASFIHSIKHDDLKEQPSFPEVFEAFCKWILSQMEVIGKEKGVNCYPSKMNSKYS
jgi:hypothetical protein